MSEEINLGLLNRVAQVYGLSFQWEDYSDESGYYIYHNGDDKTTIDHYPTIEDAFTWFKGYEKGYLDATPIGGEKTE